jgi:deoxyribodipyrimidine photo-lyase
MTVLWWIRRDLRLSDNPTLLAALRHGGPVLPVFILDPHLLERTPARRQAFLFGGLHALAADLHERGGRLIIRRGPPEIILFNLLTSAGASAIYAETDFTPYARTRDERIAQTLPLTLVDGQTVHTPAALRKADGAPYTVFTPFSRAWKALLPPDLTPLPAPPYFPPAPLLRSEELPGLPPPHGFPAGEREAGRRLEHFLSTPIDQYDSARNRLDLEGTSALSPYLRFGMLSMRQAASVALRARPGSGADTWLNELIWREFYINILYHFPHVSRTAFNPTLAQIAWRDNLEDFEAWKAGRTGLPVVDAAMRQLALTGWMHNRARMIAASFLVKDLLINWQWGERWFMENLLDGDPAANNGGWQWTAGTGTDAAPYFRIFNPVLQSQKFDPLGAYIRRWVPELASLPTPAIHAPWEAGLRVPGYPERPIVDRSLARDRALAAYQNSRWLSTGGQEKTPVPV